MTRRGKIAGIAALFLLTAVLMMFYHRRVEQQKIQKNIAREVLRLHVVANSDSEKDQALKLKVKETIVTYLRGVMGDAVSVEEAKEQIRRRLPEIEEIAREKMQLEGYDYDADATLGECYFPIREYGDLTFPAGDYEALKVNIGESKGKNWWCVMYPTLCFVDSTYQIVPEESKDKLKETLTEEEFNSLLDGGDNVQYSSGVIEWIRNAFFS